MSSPQLLNIYFEHKSEPKTESAECDAHAECGSNCTNATGPSGHIAGGIRVTIDWRWNCVHDIGHTIECDDIIVAGAAHCYRAGHSGNPIQSTVRRSNVGRGIGERFDRTKRHTNANSSQPIAPVDGRQSAGGEKWHSDDWRNHRNGQTDHAANAIPNRTAKSTATVQSAEYGAGQYRFANGGRSGQCGESVGCDHSGRHCGRHKCGANSIGAIDRAKGVVGHRFGCDR